LDQALFFEFIEWALLRKSGQLRQGFLVIRKALPPADIVLVLLGCVVHIL
jgi:hypothetical protein